MPVVVDGIEIPINAMGNVSDYVDKAKKKLSELEKVKSTSFFPKIEEDGKKVQKFLSDNAALISTTTIAVTALSTAIVSAYNQNAELVNTVRDLSLVSGEGAEETSRFLQVLDDYELTAEDATAASKKLKEQGLSPTIDTLATLSDEFRKIKDPAERMQFIQDNLGRGGAKWVNILNQGSEALRRNSAEVSKNLIVTEEQIKMQEVQRLAIDNAKDTWEGYTRQLGQNTSNVLALLIANKRASEIMREHNDQVGVTKDEYIKYDDALKQAIAEQLTSAAASIEQTDSMKEQEQAIRDLAKANEELLDLTGSFAESQRDYAEKQQEINQQLAEGKITTEEAGVAFQNLAAQQEEAGRRMILSMLEQQLALDGLDERETEYLLTKGQEWGIYSQEAVDAARAAQAEVRALTNELNSVPANVHSTITVETVRTGGELSPDAGGGQYSHARGGEWVVSAGYGNEGYPMGGGHTASAGEKVTVTPADESSSGGMDMLRELRKIFDTKQFASDVATALARTGG